MKWNMAMFAALLGAVSVALGAFGAHALKSRLDPADLAIFETGVRYQFYHVVALLFAQAVGYVGASQPAVVQSSRLASWAFVLGIAVFSGSLYALVLTGVRKLGMVTPLGGVAFVFGWIQLALALGRLRTNQA